MTDQRTRTERLRDALDQKRVVADLDATTAREEARKIEEAHQMACVANLLESGEARIESLRYETRGMGEHWKAPIVVAIDRSVRGLVAPGVQSALIEAARGLAGDRWPVEAEVEDVELDSLPAFLNDTDQFWVVVNPRPGSELEDICFRTTLLGLALMARAHGTDEADWMHGISLYRFEEAARSDALRRLEREARRD